MLLNARQLTQVFNLLSEVHDLLKILQKIASIWGIEVMSITVNVYSYICWRENISSSQVLGTADRTSWRAPVVKWVAEVSE